MISRFKPGDRVAERPKHSLLNCISKEARETVAKYSTQRYGTVVDSYIKVTQRRNKSPLRQQVVRIIWDGQRTPAEHVQMRICFVEELQELQEAYGAIMNPLEI